MLKFRFGLRAKLVLLSSFLFAIPWLGYQYVWEMEKYLRIGQERSLIATSQALATALHERPKLFDNQASFLDRVSCLLYTSPSPRDQRGSRMPSSA